jgi:hypothetical protein
MKHLPDDQLRQPSTRSLLASLIVACAGTAFVNAGVSAAEDTVGATQSLYSVVNLGVSTDTAFLNQRGQVAYSNGFFDGKRSYDIKGPGGRYVSVHGLNNLGVVVGEFDDGLSQLPSTYRAFAWTVGSGFRTLSGLAPSVAIAINDGNQAVGSISDGTSGGHANRWNPDGTQTRLGSLSANFSQATAVNGSGIAVGIAEFAQQGSHAMVWNARGGATDLGKFTGVGSVADFVNANGQVAGRYFTVPGPLGGTNTAGFFWSRTSGGVTILPFGWDNVTINALNDKGQVAGNRMYPPGDLYQHTVPFIWCLQEGARLLPVGTFPNSRVWALNNRSDMVGFTQQLDGQMATRRAVIWHGETAPVDLNTRLYRAPTELVLTSGIAINDRGVILAQSNAGLVLLRPGRDQSAAPVLGPITKATPGDDIAVNSMADFVVNFIGGVNARSHTATATIDDGCPQTAPSLREVRDQGDVSLRHVFCRAGTFNIRVRVTDTMGNVAEVQRRQFVADLQSPR